MVSIETERNRQVRRRRMGRLFRLKEALRASGLGHGMVMADLGCGYGTFSIPGAQIVGVGRNVHPSERRTNPGSPETARGWRPRAESGSSRADSVIVAPSSLIPARSPGGTEL